MSKDELEQLSELLGEYATEYVDDDKKYMDMSVLANEIMATADDMA